MSKKTIAMSAMMVIVLILAGSILLNTDNEEATVAALSQYKRPFPGEDENGPDMNYDGVFYNNYHALAAEIDMTKLPSAALLSIPEELYAGKVNFALDKVDIEGELRTYLLACEILTDSSINPPDSEISIRPYHLYGSWYNEIGFKKKDGIGFNPIHDKVFLQEPQNYLGPYSYAKSYVNTTETARNTPRLYAYISYEENKDVEENCRALRITPNEMKLGNFDVAHQTLNNGLHNLEPDNKTAYYSEFKDNLRQFKDNRPDPTYLPDAMFSYARKLRSNYDGLNNSTLNKSDLTDWQEYEQFYTDNVTREGDFKSDLYFLSSVYRNSSELRPHQLNVSAGYPNANNDYVNAMPMLYLEMIEQFGTLDIRDMGLFNGWREIGTSVQKYFGTKFVTPMYSAPIVSPDNLITRLDNSDTTILHKGEVRSLMSEVGSYAHLKSPGNTSELEWSLYYPLRCITNGKMIQAGVESIIEQVYQIQKEEGTLLTSDEDYEDDWGDNGDGDFGDDFELPQGELSDEDILNKEELTRWGNPTPDENPSGIITPNSDLDKISRDNIVFPLKLGSNQKYKVSHGYWCGNFERYGCRSYHAKYGQHYAIDYNHRTYDEDAETYTKKTTCDILAFADGEVVHKSSNYPYGTRVILKHNIGGVEFYTNYAHMVRGSTAALSVGDTVGAGSRIGHMGSTGNSSGNHLHFAIYKDNIDERNKKAITYDAMLLVERMHKYG